MSSVKTHAHQFYINAMCWLQLSGFPKLNCAKKLFLRFLGTCRLMFSLVPYVNAGQFAVTDFEIVILIT
jgi:hypothetical protein